MYTYKHYTYIHNIYIYVYKTYSHILYVIYSLIVMKYVHIYMCVCVCVYIYIYIYTSLSHSNNIGTQFYLWFKMKHTQKKPLLKWNSLVGVLVCFCHSLDESIFWPPLFPPFQFFSPSPQCRARVQAQFYLLFSIKVISLVINFLKNDLNTSEYILQCKKNKTKLNCSLFASLDVFLYSAVFHSQFKALNKKLTLLQCAR